MFSSVGVVNMFCSTPICALMWCVQTVTCVRGPRTCFCSLVCFRLSVWPRCCSTSDPPTLDVTLASDSTLTTCTMTQPTWRHLVANEKKINHSVHDTTLYFLGYASCHSRCLVNAFLAPFAPANRHIPL